MLTVHMTNIDPISGFWYSCIIMWWTEWSLRCVKATHSYSPCYHCLQWEMIYSCLVSKFDHFLFHLLYTDTETDPMINSLPLPPPSLPLLSPSSPSPPPPSPCPSSHPTPSRPLLPTLSLPPTRLSDWGYCVPSSIPFQLKVQYRDQFDSLQTLQREVQYCQQYVDQSRARLLSEFDTWYRLAFLGEKKEGEEGREKNQVGRISRPHPPEK